MRKTYQLAIDGKNPDRLLDAAKNDIRKYIKRERAKALPAGADFWDFDCKSGADAAGAADVPASGLIASVDALVKGGAASVYVEVLAKPAQRTAKPEAQGGQSSQDGFDDLDD